jgi:hypothetical protein
MFQEFMALWASSSKLQITAYSANENYFDVSYGQQPRPKSQHVSLEDTHMWLCDRLGVWERFCCRETGSLEDSISDYVHEYYSVARFRAAYEGRVEPLRDRSQWPYFDLGFTVYPPLLGRRPYRPKVVRIRGCLEASISKKKVNWHRCGNFGNFAKTCKELEMGYGGDTAPNNKRWN